MRAHADETGIGIWEPAPEVDDGVGDATEVGAEPAPPDGAAVADPAPADELVFFEEDFEELVWDGVGPAATAPVWLAAGGAATSAAAPGAAAAPGVAVPAESKIAKIWPFDRYPVAWSLSSTKNWDFAVRAGRPS